MGNNHLFFSGLGMDGSFVHGIRGFGFCLFNDRGYKAYVIRAEVNAVNLYRTKVGRFRTREEAERLLLVMKDKEAYPTAFVARM
jgi:hypothetical protein